MDGLRFSILGPLEVSRAADVFDLGPRKQRLVLASLVVAAPEVVSTDALIDRVWGERPPDSAPHALQVYVSNLRKLLEPRRAARASGEVLVTRAPGYVLSLSAETCDAHEFEALLAASHGSDDEERMEILGRALELWRGPPLADMADHPWAANEASRLTGLRLAAMEDRFDLYLTSGRHRDVVHELDAVTRRHPLRERFWAQLVVALYRSGRQADALRALAEVRLHLLEELGVDPGPELVELETAVLRHDASLTGPTPPVVSAHAPVGNVARVPDPSLSLSEAYMHIGDSTSKDSISSRSSIDSASGEPHDDASGDDRRVVTALFADLVGSTRLGEALPPDEFKLVVDGAMDRMVAACEAFGGKIVNIAGDGLLALFGAPVVHEDDAERAVLAALQLVAALTDYGAEVAAGWDVEPLASRVGVNTGLVVAGLTGAGDHIQYSALGDTVNTAARLEAAAQPDTVLVGGATQAQLGPSFTWSEPRLVMLKGKEEPVLAYEALTGRPGGGRQRGIGDRPTRLLARETELHVALDAIDDVLGGRGGVLLVTGAAGLGKSRLLAEIHQIFAERSDPQRPALWLGGTCPSYGESRPLWPIREILGAWVGESADQPALRRRVALRSRLDALVDDSSRAYAALATVMGLDERNVADSPNDPPEALHELVCEVLTLLARDRPIVVAVDDLHWADAESLRLLERLAGQVERAAILLVLASRPERQHGSWRLREHVLRESPHRSRHVELTLLDRSGSASLLDELIGVDVLPAGMRDELLSLSEGNPFYLEELVRTLIGDGVLARTEQGLAYVGGGSTRLPDGVGQVVASRLDRVGPHARSLLTAASVFGRDFTADMLSGLMGDEMSDATLDEFLVELQRQQLVREVRRWPDAVYQFEHALIREAAHDTLVVTRRNELHRRAAAVLAGRNDADEADAGEIARHWELAGDDERAFETYRTAAARAESRGIFTSAAALYVQALDAAARLGLERVEPAVLAPLLVARWTTALRGGDLEGARQGLEDAVRQARAAGDPTTEALALRTLANSGVAVDIGRTRHDVFSEALEAARRSGDPEIVARVLAPLAIDEANDLALDQARERTLEAMSVVESARPEVRAYALDARKLVALYLGELDLLRDVLTELAPIVEQPELAWMRRYVMQEQAALALAVGDMAAAEQRATEALAVSDRVSGSVDREAFLAVLCRVRRARGDYGRALEVGTEACALARASGRWWIPWAAAEQGALLIELGRFEDAIECLEPALGLDPSMVSQEVRCAALLAVAGLRGGDRDAEVTGSAATEGMLAAMSCPPGMTYLYGADAQLALAEVKSARSEHLGATDLATSVARAADDAGWVEPAARAHYVLGVDAARQGDPDAALDELQRSVDVASGVVPGVVWRAHAAIGALTGGAEAIAHASSIHAQLAETLDGDVRAEFHLGFAAEMGALALDRI